MLETVSFSHILKSDFFKYMLAPCIFYNRIRIYCRHSQDIKGVFQSQFFRASSISPAFYSIILHRDHFPNS